MIRAIVVLPLVLIEDWYMRYRMTRGWQSAVASRSLLAFPDICPRCLASPADGSVLEKSRPKTVAWLVFVWKKQWLQLKVPYCTPCERKIEHDFGMALLIAGFVGFAAAMGLWQLVGLDKEFSQDNFGPIAEILLYGACFGIPIYQILYFRNRAVVAASYDPSRVILRFRNSSYFQAFQTLAIKAFQSVKPGA